MLFEKHQFFGADAGGKPDSVQSSDVEVPGRTPTENDPDSSLAFNLVEKAEALDKERRLVEFSHSTLENRTLVDLTVVLARLPLVEEFSSSQRTQISRNAEGVGAMRLGQAKNNVLVLCQIPVSVLDRQFEMRLADALKQRPTHDSHEGFCSERRAASCLQLDLSCVICLVAGLAERYQVVGRVTARLAALKMMHIEERILGSTSTVPADMTVSEKNVLAHVPESELVALLIIRAFDFGILDLLNVEGCGFNHDFGDRKHSANRFNARYVRLNAVLHGRRKPALVLGSNAVVEAWCAVARLAIAPCTSECQTISQKSLDVLSKLDFGREDFLLFRRGGNANVFGACIDAKRHFLLRLARGDGQTDRERRASQDDGLARFQHVSRLCRRTRHQRLAAHVQNKYFQSISFADTRRLRLLGPKAG